MNETTALDDNSSSSDTNSKKSSGKTYSSPVPKTKEPLVTAQNEDKISNNFERSLLEEQQKSAIPGTTLIDFTRIASNMLYTACKFFLSFNLHFI